MENITIEEKEINEKLEQSYAEENNNSNIEENIEPVIKENSEIITEEKPEEKNDLDDNDFKFDIEKYKSRSSEELIQN
jgi:hypothetical protein